MGRSLKASLLSAFIFPGSGHFYLKKYIQGILLTAFAVACLYFMLSGALEIAQGIIIKVESGEIPLDLVKIAEAIVQQPTERTQFIKICTYLFGFLWIAGIIDSFRLGRLQGKDDDSAED